MITPEPVYGLRVFAHRLVVIFLLAMMALAVLPSPADAANRRVYAGIVVDAKSGKTLYASAADAVRYPASVTKVMTLYVLFQELEAGNLKLSSKLKVSKHAAAAVPTKLGLRAGSTISVEDAILALVTLSANDIARTIAENISGTESKFAERMTKTAKALGMSRTTYRNASGLPDSGQVTTARDQARLGIAVYQHFPKYYEYFQTRSFRYGKRTYGNHNNLLGQNGVDGIKTGYINAAGYNLLTAARKNDRHIVVVGFGFNTGAARNAKVASLVKTYLPKARRGSYVAQAKIAKPSPGSSIIRFAAVPVTPMPRPAGRDIVLPAALPAPIAVAMLDPGQAAPAPEPRPIELIPANALGATQLLASNDPNAPVPLPKPNTIAGAWISQTLHLEPTPGSNSGLIPPAAIGSTQAAPAAIDLLTSGSVTEPAVQNAWVVQIGASASESGAQSLLTEAVSEVDNLADFRSFVETTQKNGQTFYRARFAGFGDREQARTICEKLKQKNMSCLAMQS